MSILINLTPIMAKKLHTLWRTLRASVPKTVSISDHEGI